MARNVRMEPISAAAIEKIKKSPAMVALLQDITDAITEAANAPGMATGEAFVGGVNQTSKTARGYVVTKNQHGMHAEALDRRLTRALEAGRS